jgi:hypothetical protein
MIVPSACPCRPGPSPRSMGVPPMSITGILPVDIMTLPFGRLRACPEPWEGAGPLTSSMGILPMSTMGVGSQTRCTAFGVPVPPMIGTCGRSAHATCSAPNWVCFSQPLGSRTAHNRRAAQDLARIRLRSNWVCFAQLICRRARSDAARRFFVARASPPDFVRASRALAPRFPPGHKSVANANWVCLARWRLGRRFCRGGPPWPPSGWAGTGACPYSFPT